MFILSLDILIFSPKAQQMAGWLPGWLAGTQPSCLKRARQLEIKRKLILAQTLFDNALYQVIKVNSTQILGDISAPSCVLCVYRVAIKVESRHQLLKIIYVRSLNMSTNTHTYLKSGSRALKEFSKMAGWLTGARFLSFEQFAAHQVPLKFFFIIIFGGLLW